ncbi:hemicentin-1-like isoform X4 [Rhinichthys klamathensis goyatoka]|uniref:hemicentin-1-like isoform X4 n=1 Tax=Rhinichthys klamathensis goyatoka TaxID=3034132 RepID=UPI0024B4A46E|nr:hemicentin-1-like isoform X4 [Rhinichthys klamathensis goyatoka]
MLQNFFGLFYLLAVSQLLSFTGSHAAECPLQLNPERVIVEFGGPVSVDCSTSIQHKGMGWEASEGSVPMSKDSLITWRVLELTEWDIEPFCYINHKGQCEITLPVTIYKTPDSVSISTVYHTGPMMEGNQYELQCDVLNVAPVQNLTVNWYKGQTLVDQTIFTDTIITPVSKTSKLLIRPDRADDGAQYWCEAKLELGEEGPRPPPTAPSKTLSVEVYYKPKHSSSTETININDELTLNCTVKANPSPTYSWQSEHLKETIKSSVLLSSTLSSGNYTCIASNSQGRDSKVFILTSTVSGDSCSLEISPSRVVVKFGDAVSVSCVASRPVRVLGWESVIAASHTQRDLSVQWRVDSLTDWIEEPICYGVFFTAPRQCEEKLNLVLYKKPDSVSISLVNHSSPVVVGREYQLQCEVQNVAPVQYLVLRWYRGQTEVYNHSFSELSPATPVQVSSTLLIVPNRADDGAQYRCEAELELGAEGPRPPPTVQSEVLNIAVQYPPDFRSPEEEILEISEDSEMVLDCTAEGNPPPVYIWTSSNLQEKADNQPVLTAASLGPGVYTCTASNILGKRSKQFVIKHKSKGV